MIYYLNTINKDIVLKEIASVLISGGTGVLPCDTIYGLSAIYTSGKTALQNIKKREENKPFLALALLEQVKSLCKKVPDSLMSLWPGALTAVLELKNGEKQAFRVPDNVFLQELLKMTGAPIYSTSVNNSGEPALLSFKEIERAYAGKVDFLVKDREEQGTTPSTLIDATVYPFKVLRQGAFVIK